MQISHSARIFNANGGQLFVTVISIVSISVGKIDACTIVWASSAKSHSDRETEYRRVANRLYGALQCDWSSAMRQSDKLSIVIPDQVVYQRAITGAIYFQTDTIKWSHEFIMGLSS